MSRLATTCCIAGLVLQGSVEADRDVRPVAERLVLGTSATAQRHLFAVRNIPAVGIGETHSPDTRYGPFSLGVIFDFSYSRRAREHDARAVASPQGISPVSIHVVSVERAREEIARCQAAERPPLLSDREDFLFARKSVELVRVPYGLPQDQVPP